MTVPRRPQAETAAGRGDASYPRLARWLWVAVPIVGAGLSIAVAWPGCLSADVGVTMREGIDFRFLGHQAPTFGFVWSIVLGVLPLPATVAWFFVSQVVGYWLVFALLAYAAQREKSPLMMCVALVAGFAPPLLGTVALLESNTQVAVAWSLAIALGFAFPGRRSLIAGVVLIAYGFLARSGMLVAVAPVLMACFLLNRPDTPLVRALGRSVGVAVALAASTFLLTRFVLGVADRERVLTLSRVFDIAGVYQRTRTHCLPPSLVPSHGTAEAILAKYDPALVDSLFWSPEGGFIQPESDEERANLRACWLATIRRHPVEYVRVKARFALMFLMIAGGRPMRVDYSCEPANPDFGLAVPASAAYAAVRHYAERTAGTLIWSGSCWLLLTGLVVARGRARGAPHASAATALFVGVLGTLVPHFIFGQGVIGRYLFLPFLLCVCSVVLVGVARRGPDRSERIAGARNTGQ